MRISMAAILKALKQVSASVKAVKAICQPTDYRKTCEENLQKAAGNTTDPRELIKIAFKIAEKHINEASKKSTVLEELSKGPKNPWGPSELQRAYEHVG
ncbi:hypothetical protein OIU76_003081 [Salix suchowensis]|nr:hypothetical protein OIU76_003081 [Salix suchowensis]